MIINNNLTKQPKISIIITYFNLGLYIEDCIKSIQNQTYKNYEIIIVNDNSNQKNSKVLENIQNENIKKINLKENKGQLLAFLEGLKISQGEFVCMIDADDILLPHYLETLLFAHLKYNFALISSSCGEINNKNEIVSLNHVNNPIQSKKKTFKKEDIENLFNEDFNFEIQKNKNPFALWSWNAASSSMIRKSALEILNYYPNKEYWKTGADKVVFSLADLIGSSANINTVCYLYRHHDKNNSQTSLPVGNKKYLNENYVEKLINWNIKLRKDTLAMLFSNKKELISKYNKINYLIFLKKAFFCINIKICAKALKTFAHRIIHF